MIQWGQLQQSTANHRNIYRIVTILMYLNTRLHVGAWPENDPS